MGPDPKNLTLPIEDRRELIVWAAQCAGRLLSRGEEHHPFDPRLMQALAAASEFAQGTVSVGVMRQHALACHAAARECDKPAARAVARVCGHTAAIAHMAAHARRLEQYTRQALSGNTLAEELSWQKAHIPSRLFHYVFGVDLEETS